MKMSRCPVCHAHIHLDQIVQDEDGRKLLGILAKNPRISSTLVEYLTLFRPTQRDLSNARALSIAQSALELHPNMDVLKAAMQAAVEAARDKLTAGSWKAPRSGNEHGWLKSFLKDSVAAQNGAPMIETKPKVPPPAPQDAPNYNPRVGKIPEQRNKEAAKQAQKYMGKLKGMIKADKPQTEAEAKERHAALIKQAEERSNASG